jgi:hypothetical protein
LTDQELLLLLLLLQVTSTPSRDEEAHVGLQHAAADPGSSSGCLFTFHTAPAVCGEVLQYQIACPSAVVGPPLTHRLYNSHIMIMHHVVVLESAVHCWKSVL